MARDGSAPRLAELGHEYAYGADGMCASCAGARGVPLSQAALDAATDLMARVRARGGLDVDTATDAGVERVPGASASAMAGSYGGKMLGVLVGTHRGGWARVLRAFYARA